MSVPESWIFTVGEGCSLVIVVEEFVGRETSTTVNVTLVVTGHASLRREVLGRQLVFR